MVHTKINSLTLEKGFQYLTKDKLFKKENKNLLFIGKTNGDILSKTSSKSFFKTDVKEIDVCHYLF